MRTADEMFQELGYTLSVRENGFRLYERPGTEEEPPAVVMISAKFGAMKLRFRPDGNLTSLLTPDELMATAAAMSEETA